MKKLIVMVLLLALWHPYNSAQSASTGLIPLNELRTNLYKEYIGGLYPHGLNNPPSDHMQIGINFGKVIKPMTTEGKVDTLKGKYVLLSIGMSNTTQEFSYFKSIADTFKNKNPRLLIVDGAQGGQTAAVISNPAANFWTVIDQRLQNAGASPNQVVACWLKEADAQPSKPFPVHAEILLDELIKVAGIIKQRYPNCTIVYCSSRTYGGYATTALNPEPYAYESGFAVKWLIQKQIDGDPALTCTGSNPKSPWLAWGPYLWADGLIPRSDGLTWEINDFVANDRTHPSETGRKKVAGQLFNFLIQDETSKTWFLKQTTSEIKENSGSIPLSYFILLQNFPNPFNPSTRIEYEILRDTWIELSVFNAIGSKIAALESGFKKRGSYSVEVSELNRSLGSGVYYLVLNNEFQRQIKKLVLIK